MRARMPGNSLPRAGFVRIVPSCEACARQAAMIFSDPMSEEPSFPADASPDTAARDLRWMERIKTGDLEAFQEFVEAHQNRVIGFIAKMLGDETDAEDIAQHVFLRVWRNAPRWQPTAKVSTWLFKITRNLVYNEFRRRGRHPVQSLDRKYREDENDRPVQLVDVGVKTPDTVLLDAEMQAAIHQAIEELPEAQRAAIVLRRYDETPYEEIGEILNVSVPAVKSLIFRARSELREKLRRYLEG